MSEDTGIYLYKLLTGAIVAQDNLRDRSMQTEIGPSQIGGCRRQVYYQLTEKPVLNGTEPLAAILGTFIHAGIADAIKREDPFGDNFLIEQKIDAFGIPAHTDLYIRDKQLVVDWKTTTRKSLRYFPSEQQIMQVQIYAHILKANGEDPKTVSLVTIPRDGKLEEIMVHHEPYNPEIAEAGLKWLDEVKTMAENKEIPDPEKPKHFCKMYCEWYDETGVDGCPSLRRG